MSAPDVSPPVEALYKALGQIHGINATCGRHRAYPWQLHCEECRRFVAEELAAQGVRVESPPPAGPEGATERFERLAAEFYEDTRLLAPGKSVAMETWTQSYEDDRQAAWKIWIAARRRGASKGTT